VRTRKEIDECLRKQEKGIGLTEKQMHVSAVTLEVLLDIRDLLEQIDNRIDDLQER